MKNFIENDLLAGLRFLTFGADAAQVCDLHEGLGEHEGHAGPPFAGVNLQRLQQRLLQHLHLGRLLQVLSVCSDRQKKQTSNFSISDQKWIFSMLKGELIACMYIFFFTSWFM